MDAVGRVVPALPVSLVATAMLGAGGQPLTLFEIKGRVASLINDLERRGSYVHIPRADRDYAIAVGLRMLTLRHLVLEDEGTYRANPEELMLLRYYANAIVHLFKTTATLPLAVQAELA
jgi:glycerol-3-phosphate O-acyltransferase